MAGFGRASRLGKRPSSSSSSSYFSTVTMVVFVGFCILGVWMLSSSSSSFPSSSRTDTDAAIRSRASFSSSYSKRSPFLVFKDPGDEGDSDGGVGGGGGSDGSVVGEDEAVEAGDRAAEENLVVPVVSGRVHVGGGGDSGQGDTEKRGNAESEGGDADGVGENQEEAEEQQQHQEQEKGQRQQAQVSEDEESPREQLVEGGTEEKENEQERSQETVLEAEPGSDGHQELPGHTVDWESNSVSSEEPQQMEETAENFAPQLQEEGQAEAQESQNDGGADDQQQQETENVRHDNQQLQRQQEELEEGGSHEDQLRSPREQKDGDGDNDQVQQTTTTEVEGVEEQEQIPQQTKREESYENRVGDEERTEGSGDEEPQQEGADEKPSDDRAQPEELTGGADRKETPWSTQADHSQNEEGRLHSPSEDGSEGEVGDIPGHKWKLCNVTAGPDYIPCLDNGEAIRHLHSRKHFEHRERHCPEEAPTCLVPLPKGYRRSIEWPKSRDRIWYNNVPHTKLAVVKGHQNWVKVTGEYLAFPGGGTQFIHGALHYIDFIQKSVRSIAWGKHTRVTLDVGCGVASFGGYLFDKDVLTMSFAPKDEHEAQVQLALERGIPAISAVMGSQRLPFPSRVFDVVHCARCRVPWHGEGGALLLELNRVLRPGGYFVWSATPVYQKLKEDVEIWKEMTSLTKSMCWDLITIRKDRLNSVGAAIYRKPTTNECYDNRNQQIPPMCKDEDDPDAAWYVPLEACMHRVPTDASERGSRWPEEWPRRLRLAPYWLNSSQVGVYGKPAPDDFVADYEHWKSVVSKSYLNGLGIDWSKVRNVMDMRAVYGGFAAALKDLKIWVMNVVNVDSPDTLPIIYERGLFGIYHDWCESFSTYPRTYDLLHADGLFSRLKKRCNIVPVMVEVDRILRPGGKLIVRDEANVVSEIEGILKSLHWMVHLTFSKGQHGILCAEKSSWRPEMSFGSS